MTSIKEEVYKDIKRQIITCQYMPGDVIDEKELIQKYGVSRTPIREALNQLTDENLVTIVPRRGTFVAPISVKDVRDLYDYIEILEPYVVQHAGKYIPREELEHYLQIFSDEASMSQAEYTEYDQEFHNLLITYCDNYYMAKTYANLQEHIQRVRMLTNAGERITASRQEHMEIIEAMLAGDLEKMYLAAQKHAGESRKQAASFAFSR